MRRLRKICAVLLTAALLAASAVMMCSCGTAEGVKIDEKHFPDAKFREYVFENFDANGDWTLSEEELSIVSEINVFYQDISSLKGLEYFTNLQSLSCVSCPLDELDLSKNTELTYLYCSYCELGVLDLSNNIKINEIWCSKNNLNVLDLSKNTKLIYLYCSDNNLTELDVSNCTKLEILDCSNNSLTALDLSKNTTLGSLDCSDNNLTEIDVSNCSEDINVVCGETVTVKR